MLSMDIMTLPSSALRPVSLASLSLLAALTACKDPPSADNGDENDTTADTGTETETDSGGDESPQIICEPGQTRCAEGDLTTMEECAPTGLRWDPLPCEGYEQCRPIENEDTGNIGAVCWGPCEQLADTPTSEGCSFYTTGLYQASLSFMSDPADFPDAIVVGNPQIDLDAEVELRFVPYGTNQEEVVEGPVTIAPGDSHVFLLDPYITLYESSGEETSLYRSGVVYHATSNLPVVAYLHAPYIGDNSNGSTLLLPEHALQSDYVVYSHNAWVAPNYFTVIAIENETEVTWTPTADTAGNGWPIDFVDHNLMQSGTQLLNRFDNIRVDTSIKNGALKCEQDLSGTVITANKPIWVVSAVRGLRLPFCGSAIEMGCPGVVDTACNGGSDYAMEQNLPLDYWGQIYVGPASPVRNMEQHVWRVYAGDDDVTIDVTPDQGGPINLAKRGEWVELIVPTGTDLLFEGDGPFMPVQYVTGHYDNADMRGSPAMIQMVPTAQFLDRYVFVTGTNYDEHYVQVIRESGQGQIILDGNQVSGWNSVGDWQVATVLIEEGAHEIHSVDPNNFFGIVQYGYSPYIETADQSAGYGYMGGMKAEEIYIP